MALQSMPTTQQNTSNFNTAPSASFIAPKRFYDDANFPKGFKRSGDFTSKEAELLELYGVAMKSLAEGSTLPCTPDEIQFVDVIKGHHLASSLLAQIWIKYCKLASGKPFYGVVGTVHLPTKKVDTDIIFDDIQDDDVQDDAQDDLVAKDNP